MKIFLILVSLILALSGCFSAEPETVPEEPEINEIPENSVSEPEENSAPEEAKIFLPLINFTESGLELPDDAVVEGKRVNIPLILPKDSAGKESPFEIPLRPEIIAEIQKDYPDFEPEDSGWKAVINFIAADGKAAIIKINYYIDENIITDKAIIATVEEDVIVRLNYTNMDFEADEEKIRKKAKDFLDSTTQTKRIFEEGEEFLSEDTLFHYHYPSGILVYSYQLYFYCGPEDMKVINNDYGYECIVE